MFNSVGTGFGCFYRGIDSLHRCVLILVVCRDLSMNGTGNDRLRKVSLFAGEFACRDILLLEGEAYRPLGGLIGFQLEFSSLGELCSGAVCFVCSPFCLVRRFFDLGIGQLILGKMESC